MTQPNGGEAPGTGEGEASSAGQQPPAPKPGEAPPPPPRTFTQAEYNSFEARTRREYEAKAAADAELIELGKQAKESLNAQRPLEERVATVTGELTTTQRERDEVKLENKRMKLAATAGLDPVLWDRVRGSSDDEINADIETLKPLMQPVVPTPPAGGGAQRPTPNQQQGTPSNNDGARTGSTSAGRDLFNQRHGKKAESPAN